jgi:hypothetical protein
MIQFTWLQSRTQNLVAIAGLVGVAILTAVTGPHLVHLYDTTIAACQGQDACEAATTAFLRNSNSLRGGLGVLVMVVPGILGIFWGAPLVAREYEAGTYRLAWTQSVTRTRWLAVKLGVIGLASTAVAGLLSLMVTWWANPIDRARMSQFATFDLRDVVPIGYAALAFVLGVTAGVLIRRTLPAMAGALIAFVGVRLAMTQWIRPHLIGPVHANLPITSAHGLGFGPSPSGVTFFDGIPDIPNALVVSHRLVDQAGQAPTASSLHQFLQAACPIIANPAPPPARVVRAPGDKAVFLDCLSHLSAKFHEAVAYQPANRYWALQWYELAIFLGAALILSGLCIWWVRGRRS